MKTWSLLAICCWSFCFARAEFRPIYNLAGSSTNKTGLSCLNEDCQIEVLEQMDLVELMVMAKTSTYYENMASNVFKRKYSSKIFMIGNEFSEGFMIPPFDKTVVEIDIKLAEQILKTFGHMIQKVMINWLKIGDENQSRKINEYIRQYCSKSLIEFYFFGFTENPFKDISNSFEKVEFVSLVGFDDNPVAIGNDTVKITDIFPALKRLQMSISNLENQECVNIVYPNLKELQLDLQRNSFEVATVEEILTKNPHIQSLRIQPTTLSMLKKVNDILPNLEKISFNFGFMDQGLDHFEEIRFKNLKALSISFDICPSNLVFDQLEEVQFSNLYYRDGWIEYFAKFPTIKKFNATEDCIGGELNATTLQSLAVQLPNLTELGFFPNKNLTKNDVVDLFECNPKIEKIFLAVSSENFNNDLKNEISEEFHVHCNIGPEGWGVVTIERKELN